MLHYTWPAVGERSRSTQYYQIIATEDRESDSVDSSLNGSCTLKEIGQSAEDIASSCIPGNRDSFQ